MEYSNALDRFRVRVRAAGSGDAPLKSVPFFCATSPRLRKIYITSSSRVYT